MSNNLREASPTPLINGACCNVSAVTKRTAVNTPSPFAIFNACVNDLTGKDKLAKVVQYTIRLLNDIYTVCVDVKREGRLVDVLAYLTKRLALLLQGLNAYRHMLRAGTMPFRLWKLLCHLRYSLRVLLDKSKANSTAMRVEKVVQYWTRREMFSEFINLWYAFSDEILLLFRFKLLLREKEGGWKMSEKLFYWAEDHELYAWMAIILNGLYNDWKKLAILKEKEASIILNQRVRARTVKIVNGLHGKGQVQLPIQVDRGDEVSQLAEVRHEMRTIYINSVRLGCDFLFDGKYVFRWDMYKPLHTSLGFISGILGVVNTWRSQREKLKE
ncbi:hypothetical protein CANINC_002847 [Pichia inconspicua]|uniref:Peroxisomal membrane protein PEX25 n=1 Tax=Pichia inconspicua TaxID=52247 RepID=A0A4T0X053_9ASCO|nr:hypothetical protein CANINC_002847 [[Candida] inconspicua]